ncbi:MAG TPA: cytochrome c biogenesis protein CcdA [Actinocrinis sp.]|uniref:cytochrome c biogenesis CcdA family protein n=1 Tax=Actinocrinis sp. TaxID=1920516 RepID=UPI002DDD08E4|nr:cytochrome c biogenesis protein CcdA [Actinocrinis sp.]HEV3171885.1 cytochrome c biogenesis protein CcdA [Actinocrinis sp.]
MSSVASVIDGGSLLLAAPVALAAGAVSFASPCVLPLVPGYLSYVTGMSGADATDAQAAQNAEAVKARRLKRWRTVLGAALFVLGFTAVFVSMGAAFGEAGVHLLVHQKLLEQVFGSLMILMGLFFAGVFPERWGGFLQRDARIRYRPTVGLVGAPLLGVVFGIGWTPCLGPTLTAVQSLAITQSSAGRGAFLSAVYCLGLGLPFILTAVAFRRAMTAFGWIKRHYGAVTRIGGGMLVVVGAAMVSGVWDHLIRLLQVWFGGFSLPL